MDSRELISRLEARCKGAVHEVRPFGRSGELSVWVESGALFKVASELRENATFSMDWLESLSAMELDGTLVLTYFVRSSLSEQRMIFRTTLAPGKRGSNSVASVARIWPMALSQEKEAEDRFGIEFERSEA